MNKTSKKNLAALLNKAKTSTAWKDKAENELKNKGWQERSFFVALAILKTLKSKGKSQSWLANELGCSRQYMHKLLQGKENLTFETVHRLEMALGIELMRISVDFKENRIVEIPRSRINKINQSTGNPQATCKLPYSSTLQVVHVLTNENTAA